MPKRKEEVMVAYVLTLGHPRFIFIESQGWGKTSRWTGRDITGNVPVIESNASTTALASV